MTFGGGGGWDGFGSGSGSESLFWCLAMTLLSSWVVSAGRWLMSTDADRLTGAGPTLSCEASSGIWSEVEVCWSGGIELNMGVCVCMRVANGWFLANPAD